MATTTPATPKKRIFINGFDMFTPSHLSFGQWKRPEDRSKTKQSDLSYWTDLAKLLEKGDVTALFIADTYAQHDVYKGEDATAFSTRVACQYPVGDPIVPVSAMAAVTKRLGFAITNSTSYEAPFLLAKRMSTIDHLSGGRFGWNIVTSYKESAAKAIGVPLVEHDKRYAIADEYLEILYKVWEGSWADDALKLDADNDVFADPDRVRVIRHHSANFSIETRHILDPSPQRTPFLFQAGTSKVGMEFAARHAEATFMNAWSPELLAERVAHLRSLAASYGRDPQSIKVFASVTPIIGRTDEEAHEKYQRALQFANEEAGLAFYSSNAGIDLSKHDLDTPIRADDVTVDGRLHSLIDGLRYRGGDTIPEWTPRHIGKATAIGSGGPVPIGSPSTVADILETWMDIADLDGFNVGAVISPGSFEDLVELLIPELRRRGRYPAAVDPEDPNEPITLRERVYGAGQSRLRDDHIGSKWKYDRWEPEA